MVKGIRLANFVGFQIGWAACVLGAAQGFPWAGPLVVAALALWTVRVSRDRAGEVRLIVFCAALGFLLDSFLALIEVFAFRDGFELGWVSRPWMVALWVNFALTLRLSMSWLQGRYLTAAVLGAMGGPLAYAAGARLGAVELNGIYSFSILALAWAITIPLLSWMAAHEDARQGRAGASAFAPMTRRTAGKERVP